MAQILDFRPKNGDGKDDFGQKSAQMLKSVAPDADLYEFSPENENDEDIEEAVDCILDAYDLVITAMDKIQCHETEHKALEAVARTLFVVTKSLVSEVTD